MITPLPLQTLQPPVPGYLGPVAVPLHAGQITSMLRGLLEVSIEVLRKFQRRRVRLIASPLL